MILNCVIVDDEPLALDLLESYVGAISSAIILDKNY